MTYHCGGQIVFRATALFFKNAQKALGGIEVQDRSVDGEASISDIVASTIVDGATQSVDISFLDGIRQTFGHFLAM